MLRNPRPAVAKAALGETTGARLDRIEILLLILCAPCLLFPTLSRAGTLAACIAILPIWLVRKFVRGRLLPPTPFGAAVVVWLSAVAIGIVVSADPGLTIPKATGLLLGITLWRTVLVAAHSPKRRAAALVLFLSTAAAMIAVGAAGVAWQQKVPLLGGLAAQLPGPLLWMPENGAEGVHSNLLAGTIVICWPLSLALLTAGRSESQPAGWLARWLISVAAAITIIGGGLLLLLQSRSAWLGAAAGLASLYLSRAAAQPGERRHMHWFGWVLAALVVVTLGAGLMVALGRANLPETVAFRIEVWRYALEAIGDFPFTGVGLGSFREVVLRLYPMTVYPNPDVAHAHNIFLQVALDTGLPGLCAYISLLLIAIRVCWQRLRGPGADAALARGTLASLIAVHVFGLADAIAPGAKPGLLYWWLLGLSAALTPPVNPRLLN